jgi:hypothetical protein
MWPVRALLRPGSYAETARIARPINKNHESHLQTKPPHRRARGCGDFRNHRNAGRVVDLDRGGELHIVVDDGDLLGFRINAATVG